MTWMVKEGSINKEEFNTFVQNQVLPLMQSFPQERSVLIMDNNSTHHSEVITNT